MNQHTTLLDGYKAALDWWREAGVDMDFADEPADWLRAAEPEAVAETPPAPPPRPREKNALERALADTQIAQPIGGERTNWPKTLSEFREFWLHEPSLDDGRMGERVVPRGTAGARVMMLVGQPDDSDRELLLSGEQGRVAEAFARAAGLSENEIYIASALPRPTPLPDWEALAARGLADVLHLHIRLAEPQRLLVFGRGLAPLLGKATEEGNVNGCPVMVAPSLENIDRSPSRKKRFWNNWLEWTS
ncbi:hypothetical protein [Qipengyuania spongiae]|uniref:Uracil-DNA glycosylase-like domain-containing protein n=1 Tax=Qipengyuania spongiae TaxID=2909673 RepID=A0ABY5T100_9SPHN|nr:hypothetical protein [Qipengyuania spongiae]UVI39001.1 hypothetical protein L1F33_12285 [Qipengyuania spongiae]